MQRILLVEPSFYGVDFVKSAKNMGCEVICVVSNINNPKKYGYEDLYDDLVVADIRNDQSILKAIGNSEYHSFDAIIPATDYALEVTAKVANKLGVFGNSIFSAHCARNKDAARKEYQKKGVPSAKFEVVDNMDSAFIASNNIGFPLILKPTNTASSIDVFYIDNKDTLKQRFEEISQLKTSYMGFKVNESYIMEEFLDGPEFSVELFLNNDSIAFAEVTEKITTDPPYFVELMHVFPTTIETNNKKEIIQTAYRAVQAIDIHNGPTHVEIKLTAQGAKVVEVNGRPGGDHITSDLIKNAYGINIFSKTIDLYLNHTVEITPLFYKSALIKFLFSTKNGILKGITGLDALKTLPEFNKLNVTSKYGSSVQIPTNSDDRLGYYILVGDDGLKLKDIAEQYEKQITVIVE